MATRRISPKLLAAFESASVEPLDMDSPGRIIDVPVPAEHFQQPAPAPAVAPQKTRLQMVQEYLEQKRAPMGPPDFGPDVDLGAAREQDAQRDFGAGMLAAGQAFTGNRRAVGQLQETNTNEAKALGAQATRRKAIADYYAAQDERALDEARVLSSAGVEPREASKPSKTTEQIDRELAAKEFANETGRIKVEMVKPPKAPKAPDAAPLRKEFDSLPEVKSFKDVSIGMDKIRTAAKSGTAPGDMALIFAFMKILDPGSSVKEGEYASAKNAQGVPDKVLTAYNNAKDGQILSPAARSEFLKASEELFETERARYSSAAQRYRGMAEKKKLSPDDVAVDRPGVSPETPDIPPKGSVMVVDIESGAVMPLSPAAAAAAIKAGKARAQ
jgi:hypothetical protein